MVSKKSYNFYLDIFRIFLCFYVFMYHLNVFNGGFLAVCGFFVLYGYLKVLSVTSSEKFNLWGYYKKQFIRIYIPLLFVVFLTIFVASKIGDFYWLNMRNESFSVLLGLNNFWQINSSVDYFARSIDSPFIHLWYISILIQFDIVFPVLYLIGKKIYKKLKKTGLIIFSLIITFFSVAIFVVYSLKSGINVVYYNTFLRVFSILLGVSGAVLNLCCDKDYFKLLKKNNFTKIIFTCLLLFLVILFSFVSSNSKYYYIWMILVSFISLAIIYCSNFLSLLFMDDKNRYIYKFIRYLAGLTYLIYLVQMPVIFLLKFIVDSKIIYYLLVVIITLVISWVLYFILKKDNYLNKRKWFCIILLVFCYVPSLIGLYQLIISKDNSKEMMVLKEELKQNEKQMKAGQKLYIEKNNAIINSMNAQLNDIEITKENLKNSISSLPIIGVGDSVMLGAINNLYDKFPNGYFDAKVSRTAWVVNDILKDLANQNKLGNPILLNLGANGDCPYECKKKIMQTCSNREVFWINITNNKILKVNESLDEFAKEYDNLHIIDWYNISRGHKEYFVSDGIHLTEEGRKVYVDTIFDELYNFYAKDYDIKIQEILNQKENLSKQKVSFYGNNLLIQIYDKLNSKYVDSKYVLSKTIDLDLIKSDLKSDMNNGILSHKIIIGLDDKLYLDEYDINSLSISAIDSKFYYILFTKNDKLLNSDLLNDNVVLIDFYTKLQNNPNYLSYNKQYLSSDGKKALFEMINESVK